MITMNSTNLLLLFNLKHGKILHIPTCLLYISILSLTLLPFFKTVIIWHVLAIASSVVLLGFDMWMKYKLKLASVENEVKVGRIISKELTKLQSDYDDRAQVLINTTQDYTGRISDLEHLVNLLKTERAIGGTNEY